MPSTVTEVFALISQIFSEESRDFIFKWAMITFFEVLTCLFMIHDHNTSFFDSLWSALLKQRQWKTKLLWGDSYLIDKINVAEVNTTINMVLMDVLRCCRCSIMQPGVLPHHPYRSPWWIGSKLLSLYTNTAPTLKFLYRRLMFMHSLSKKCKLKRLVIM